MSSTTKYMRLYRIKNRVKIRKYNREYNKRWRKKNGYHNEQNSKNRYPQKEKSRKLLRYAVEKGIILKTPCEICGKTNSQGHHNNYQKPFEVKWLCPLHHTALHKFNNLTLADKYATMNV